MVSFLPRARPLSSAPFWAFSQRRWSENIQAAPYPSVLATSSLNDTRVQVGEPLKWVTRLRETVTSDQEQCPILMKTEMVAGHGGRSGRYDSWRETAFELAFLLDAVDAREVLGQE